MFGWFVLAIRVSFKISKSSDSFIKFLDDSLLHF